MVAARYMKQAADRGNKDAQFRYGDLTRTGKGIKRNAKDAARYYKMAADQGHAQAQYNYSVA